MEDKGLSGLCNMGNTCYLNAALQCLSNTKLLSEFLSKNKNKKGKMMGEYNRILNGLWEENCIIQPISFKRTLGKLDDRFDDNSQHDAQEALFTLIDLFHTEMSFEVNIYPNGVIKNDLDKKMVESIKVWSKYFNKQYSEILNIFYGQFYSKITCIKCKYELNNYDPFSMIALPITNTSKNIYDCFDDFIKHETLDSENKWKCEKCNELSESIKEINIWKSPNILILVLKRFSYTENYSSKKINNIIDFPLFNLNLTKYVNGYDKYDSIYNIYGIIYHHGNLNFGHYTACCKNKMNNKWYLFDDENVSECKSIRIQDAYILFYEKKYDK